jgi:hypothetical protein
MPPSCPPGRGRQRRRRPTVASVLLGAAGVAVLKRLHMANAAISINPEKASRSTSASTASFQAEPRSDPPTPARPNTVPAPSRTRPARQCGMMPISAVMVTSTSDVVVALFGSWPAA